MRDLLLWMMYGWAGVCLLGWAYSMVNTFIGWCIPDVNKAINDKLRRKYKQKIIPYPAPVSEYELRLHFEPDSEEFENGMQLIRVRRRVARGGMVFFLAAILSVATGLLRDLF